MIGSPAAAALIAQIVFWALLAVGLGELGIKRVCGFIALRLVGYVASGRIPLGGPFFVPYVAVLDIVLVFVIFKGDVRLG